MNQIIILSTPNTNLKEGDQFTVTVGYDVSTGNNALSGIGANIHFDATELQFDSANVLLSGFAINPTSAGLNAIAETVDDGDAETNQQITFGYATFNLALDFPNTTLPVDLLTLTFTTLTDFDGTSINVTENNTAATFDFQADPLVLTEDETVDPLTGLTTEVFRFYRPGSQAHLYTRDLNEVAFFRTRPDVFVEEGVSFRASLNDNNGTLKAVRRFYNSQTDGHFFTMNEVEIASVQANQVAAGIFQDEGIAFYALEDATPSLGSDIFRFSNVFTGAHFFTNSVGERDAVLANQVAAGVFRFEGVGWEGAQP